MKEIEADERKIYNKKTKLKNRKNISKRKNNPYKKEIDTLSRFSVENSPYNSTQFILENSFTS